MTPARFSTITTRYPSLRLGLAGDFCLDRYLEIDPRREEISIETGLAVYNVVQVRPQPGAAGTILNNLVALGIGSVLPIGFAGIDGEGFELTEALRHMPGVDLKHFVQTPLRRTFTYCKPLLMHPGKAPVELNRLDSKNWSMTPETVSEELSRHLSRAAEICDAVIVLDQVDVAETGVVTTALRQTIRDISGAKPDLLILADSRRGLRDFPPCAFKMNVAELARFRDGREAGSVESIKAAAAELAVRNQRPVFVTAAERGMVGAMPNGDVHHVPSFRIRGEIDIVGAGDSVSANLTAALAAGATLVEALELASAAASVVIHKLGTTGTANVEELRQTLFN